MSAMTHFNRHPVKQLALCAVALAFSLNAQAQKKEFKYTVAAGATVSVANQRGAITVKPASGRQVIISANFSADSVEIDAAQTGSRVTVRTHTLSKANPDLLKVDYDIQLPTDVNIAIDSGSGDVRIENVRGNVTVDAEEGQVDIRGVSGGIVQVQSVNGGISLTNLQKTRVQTSSAGGSIQLNGVSGPSVTAKSTTGSITFAGDFAGGGNYLLTNHSGDITISMPTSASVELNARSIQGAVENDFPLQKTAHSGFAAKEGKTLVGTSNTGASSVELRSFSGKIRVKKQ